MNRRPETNSFSGSLESNNFSSFEGRGHPARPSSAMHPGLRIPLGWLSGDLRTSLPRCPWKPCRFLAFFASSSKVSVAPTGNANWMSGSLMPFSDAEKAWVPGEHVWALLLDSFLLSGNGFINWTTGWTACKDPLTGSPLQLGGLYSRRLNIVENGLTVTAQGNFATSLSGRCPGFPGSQAHTCLGSAFI